MKTKKTFRVNRRYAERKFAVRKIGELVKTREFETNLHLYKAVHVDDQDILFERGNNDVPMGKQDVIDELRQSH